MISELLKERLQIILNDELLLKAVELVFKETIENLKPNINETDDNTKIGEKYRAFEVANEIIKAGFNNLQNYKIEKQEKKDFNRAI